MVTGHVSQEKFFLYSKLCAHKTYHTYVCFEMCSRNSTYQVKRLKDCDFVKAEYTNIGNGSHSHKKIKSLA